MADLPSTAPRCEACGNLIDEEDLFCGNCGREAPPSEGLTPDAIEGGFVGFDCNTCGASLTYDAEAQGLRCAFCGSVSLERQPQATGRIRAERYIPFAVEEAAALEQFRRWISKGFFRPFGFTAGARVVSLRPVYLPCWSFSADAYTHYCGDSSVTPPGARAGWMPVFGTSESHVAGVLVPASGSLRKDEIADIEPFELSGLQPYVREEISGSAVEDFGVSRRGARPRARARFLEREQQMASSRIPGKSRNVRVNPLFTNLRSEPVLLPVWISAYRFRDVTYRFLVNGQTGRLVGRAPFSALKLVLVILAAVAVGVAVLGVAAS
jgi:predicted RNA-binding Zn-ribbon protein involved in translation (DUF1610 family)